MLPEAADAFLKACRETYGLAIAGLMCIPPADEPPAPHFALTAKIAQRNGLKLLSMGMSADFADRDRVRRHPCAGRHGDLRRTGLSRPGDFVLKSADRRFACPARAAPAGGAASPASSATQPAVGPRFGRATWTNTALPRPAMRGRVLWSISMMKS